MNWCFWTVVLEKTLESSLDCKEIKPVNPKGNQSWIFIGRTDGEAEIPILWPHDVKNWLTGKDLDARKDWRQEEKGMTEDEMVVWHHWLDGHEFEQAVGVGDGQGSLACCPWGVKKSDMTEWLNWTWPHPVSPCLLLIRILVTRCAGTIVRNGKAVGNTTPGVWTYFDKYGKNSNEENRQQARAQGQCRQKDKCFKK